MYVNSEKNLQSTRVDINNAKIEGLRCIDKSIDDLESSYVPYKLQKVYEPKINGFKKPLMVENNNGVGFPSYGYAFDLSNETRYPEGYRYKQINTSTNTIPHYPSYGFYCNNK